MELTAVVLSGTVSGGHPESRLESLWRQVWHDCPGPHPNMAIFAHTRKHPISGLCHLYYNQPSFLLILLSSQRVFSLFRLFCFVVPDVSRS